MMIINAANLMKINPDRIKRELTGEDYRIPLFSNPKIEWEILKHISKYPPFKGDDKNPPIDEIEEGHLIDSLYLISILNSTLLNWRFELFSLQNNIRNYEIESLPIPRISLKEQKPFIILAKYMLFLKQYQNYFAKDDMHLKYVIDYFDNLIDCLVYELYLGDVIKIPIRQFIEDKLEDINLPDNLLETPEKEREEIYSKIHRMLEELEGDKKLNENLYMIKHHEWVKVIYTSLER